MFTLVKDIKMSEVYGELLNAPGYWVERFLRLINEIGSDLKKIETYEDEYKKWHRKTIENDIMLHTLYQFDLHVLEELTKIDLNRIEELGKNTISDVLTDKNEICQLLATHVLFADDQTRIIIRWLINNTDKIECLYWGE